MRTKGSKIFEDSLSHPIKGLYPSLAFSLQMRFTPPHPSRGHWKAVQYRGTRVDPVCARLALAPTI